MVFHYYFILFYVGVYVHLLLCITYVQVLAEA